MDSLHTSSPHLPFFCSQQQLEEMSIATTNCVANYYCLAPNDATFGSSTTSSIDGSASYASFLVEQSCNEKKKRKSEQGGDTSLVTTHTKDAKTSKNRKQKRNGDEEKCCVQPPTGYIHVRARRGQATDSHSLAERVRREKISERMKMLQELVPGCDKVNGKAHMLDEIINYVQSLQSQVEFLSMKLASVSPIWYDFGMEFDDGINHEQENVMKMSISQEEALVDQPNQLHPTSFGNGAHNYHLMAHTSTVSFQGEGPTPSFPQDTGSFDEHIGGERQGLLNQLQHLNMCTFH